MKITIKRWGNGAGITLSKALRKHLHADIGDNVDVCITEDGLLIHRAVQPQYKLDELLATCTPQNTRLDARDIAWVHDVPVGKEI
ncbi:MAG: hypothetical protein QM709_12150 [Spongiibacteraceae bacterium]